MSAASLSNSSCIEFNCFASLLEALSARRCRLQEGGLLVCSCSPVVYGVMIPVSTIPQSVPAMTRGYPEASIPTLPTRPLLAGFAPQRYASHVQLPGPFVAYLLGLERTECFVQAHVYASGPLPSHTRGSDPRLGNHHPPSRLWIAIPPAAPGSMLERSAFRGDCRSLQTMPASQVVATARAMHSPFVLHRIEARRNCPEPLDQLCHPTSSGYQNVQPCRASAWQPMATNTCSSSLL